eukprot:TRINITY_DN3325_c3_g1_i7.p1 TRINITY_DN3325_c3_g1~~TRINITY_DN3325_c3_g1_i7.p1  ORF type:complete len:819 (-),score=52.47 TRINITY_DN3325_c3_g1_i7:394-2850(-)
MIMDPQFYKLLGIRFDEELFEAVKLPFGLAVAPSYFSSMMNVLIRHLRSQNIRMTYYLDDILIVAETKKEAERAIRITIDLFEKAKLKINMEKSKLCPVTAIEFRGWTFFFKEEGVTVILQQSKRIKLAQFSQQIENPTTVGYIQKLSGYLEFAYTFHKELYVLKTKVARLLAGNKSKDQSKQIRLSDQTLKLIRGLPKELAKIKPALLSVEPRTLVIATDASMDGAGCVVFDSGQTFSFKEQEGNTIAMKELKTVGKAIQEIAPGLPMRSNILIFCDNKNAISALEGRAKSKTLMEEGLRIREAARTQGIFIEARYISTRENIIADALSREKEINEVGSNVIKLPSSITIPPKTPKTFYDPIDNKGMWPALSANNDAKRPKTGGPARRQAVIDSLNERNEGVRNFIRRIDPAPRITKVDKLPIEMQSQASLSIGHGSFRKKKGNFIIPLPTIVDDEGSLYLEGSQIDIVENWMKESFKSGDPNSTIKHKVAVENSPLSFWLDSKESNNEKETGLSQKAKEFLRASTKESTRKNYTATTKRFVTFIRESLPGFNFKKVDIDHILQFMQHLREEGLQPQTMKNYLTGIMGTIKIEAPEAFKRISQDPLLEATRRTLSSLSSNRANPRPMKERAFEELNAQFILDWYSKRRSWDDQAMTVIAIMLLTGARISEAVRTRNPAFGKEKAEINSDLSLSITCASDETDTGLKAGRVVKSIPLEGLTSPQGELIQEMILTRHDFAAYLCFNYLPEEKEFDKLARRVRNKLKKLGISPHDFRHSYARSRFRQLQADGMSRNNALSIIRDELGHSSHDAILSYGDF